jgi:hypothetical protein
MGLPEHDRGRPGEEAASNVTAGDFHSLPPSDLNQFAKRLLLEAFSDASRQWWLKRAEVFERARPVPGEFHGNMTPEQLRAQWLHLSEVAAACRARAGVCEPRDASADLDAVWSEVAA